MRQKLLFLFVIFWIAVAVYFAWAWNRVNEQTLHDDRAWPRLFPYPDTWLLDLNNWFDARYPAAPGHIKIHGELDRVRLSVLAAFSVASAVASVGTLILIIPLVKRHRSRRGFDVMSPQ